MSRLVAFGCSNTYGHGLEDCHIEPINPGHEPSKFAWPSLLANMMNLEVVNYSKPGSSNLHILWRLINFKFEPDDLCVIMWTHFGRLPFAVLKYDSSMIEWNDYTDNRFKHQLPELEAENIIIKNVIAFHHASTFLEKEKIKHLMLLGSNDFFKVKVPDIEIPSLDKDIIVDRFRKDVALDKRHPGPITHQNIAKEIFNKLNVIY
jgi:hypothetical protein